MGEFYGLNIFLAETSATSGGLDSLLEPTGPIKKAQELAAAGVRLAAHLLRHQRHIDGEQDRRAGAGATRRHRAGRPELPQVPPLRLVLGGAQVVYLDCYPLHQYSMYGAVPLRDDQAQLLRLPRAGTLDRVKMLLLTNCTFDGIVYDVRAGHGGVPGDQARPGLLLGRGLVRVRPLPPDLSPAHRHGLGRRLRRRYRSAAYAEEYAEFRASFDADDESLAEHRLMPDPDKVRIRVYATHSTHKTLTCLRQGSMIHVHDQDFQHKVEDTFHEAYMTHTSTSPNYQILASLDVGRRQVELEGFELVQKQLEMAMVCARRCRRPPVAEPVLPVPDRQGHDPGRIPPGGIEAYYEPDKGWTDFFGRDDEFVLDPTRLTLWSGLTGVDGDTFKNGT